MPTHPAIPIETVMVPYGKEEYELRVYRPERFAPVTAEAKSDQLGPGDKVGSSATDSHAEQETPPSVSGSAKERIKAVAEWRKLRPDLAISARAVWEDLGAPKRSPTLDYVRRQLKDMGYT